MINAEIIGLSNDNHMDIPKDTINMDPKDISNANVQYKKDKNIKTTAINNFLLNFSLKDTTKKFVT